MPLYLVIDFTDRSRSKFVHGEFPAQDAHAAALSAKAIVLFDGISSAVEQQLTGSFTTGPDDSWPIGHVHFEP